MFDEVLEGTFALVREQIFWTKKENKDAVGVSQYCLKKGD